VLLDELKGTPANRGACLEGIATAFESAHLSDAAIGIDLEGRERFRSLLVSVLSFAVAKLNEKGMRALLIM
jgi:hypothetical protein